MSGGSARTIRRYSVELWQDLVLHGIRKSTFQHSTVNWNFNVLEMARKTLHFVQGLSRTPLLFIPRYLTNTFSKNVLPETNLENQQSENLKIQKTRFTNRSPVNGPMIGNHIRGDPEVAVPDSPHGGNCKRQSPAAESPWQANRDTTATNDQR